MRAVRLLAGLLVLAAAVLAAASRPPRAGEMAPVPNKVPRVVDAFALQDVRLLDGPFKEATLRDQRYLLSLDLDRLLHNFRVNVGLPSKATPLGGWEAPDVELRGHSIGHFLSALALMYASTGDARFKAQADAMVAELATIQQAAASKGYHVGYLSAFPEEFIDRVETRGRVWAPYYTLHKIMAGLLEVYALCGNHQALDILVKMADWVKFRMDRLTEGQQQAMLKTEFGGMNEVLANLYGVTGNADYLRIARAFDHMAIFDPLARGEDPLNGLHGNTQFPKIIGAVREYELTGETRYYDIATFFWRRVALNRSFVIGGNTDDESFFPIEEFSKHLGASSTETCNTYNMLKLTRQLFQLAPSAELMEFYERGLFNHILASQDPATGMMCYYVPLRPGAFKTYSTPDQSFWCCVGTGMENHAKYADTIYFHDSRSLYVNLFIASELTWKDKELVVRQETKFPEEEGTRLTITAARPVRLALNLRYPAWAQSGMTVAVNGTRLAFTASPGSYVTVDREWKKGDTVQVRLPMKLRIEAMPDDPRVFAFLYGPIVLAGDLGTEGLIDKVRYGPSAPPMDRMQTPPVPALVTDARDVRTAVTPVAGAPLTFRTVGIGRPRDVTLVPFYRAFDRRYTVYWTVYTPAEWKTKAAQVAAAKSRWSEIERRTVDLVDVNDPQSEKDHRFEGDRTVEGYLEGRRYREAGNGSFGYVLKVPAGGPAVLVCTYRGSEGRQRIFDVLVDGEKIATETLPFHPTETLVIEHALPTALIRGKDRVTVTFRAGPGAMTGGVLEVRIVRVER